MAYIPVTRTSYTVAKEAEAKVQAEAAAVKADEDSEKKTKKKKKGEDMKKFLIICAVLAIAGSAFAQYEPAGRAVQRVSKASIAVADLANGANSVSLDYAIPKGALIWDGVTSTTTALSSTNDANFTISIGTGQTAIDLLAVTYVTNGYEATGYDQIVPLGTAATCFALTQEVSAVNITVAGPTAATNGAMTLWIHYTK